MGFSFLTRSLKWQRNALAQSTPEFDKLTVRRNPSAHGSSKSKVCASLLISFQTVKSV
jgi:hypothetical protein